LGRGGIGIDRLGREVGVKVFLDAIDRVRLKIETNDPNLNDFADPAVFKDEGGELFGIVRLLVDIRAEVSAKKPKTVMIRENVYFRVRLPKNHRNVWHTFHEPLMVGEQVS
jgi:hypothetical protein